MKRNNKKDIYILITLIILLITTCIVILGFTYGWFNSSLTGGNYLIKSGKISVNYDNGTSIINGSLFPSVDKNGGISSTVRMGLNDDSLRVYGKLELEVTHIPTVLGMDALIWEVYRNDELEPVMTGNFAGISTGDKITLVDNDYLTTTQKAYTLYIWIDGNQTGNEIQNQDFTARIIASARQTNVE